MSNNYSYIHDPVAIEQQSFQQIRSLCDLSAFDRFEQQVVMRIVHSVGVPEIAQFVRISETACAKGMAALSANKPILCDVEMVKQGLTKRLLTTPPLCFLNDERSKQLATSSGETRSMAALEFMAAAFGG